MDDSERASYFQVTVDLEPRPAVVRAAGELDAASSDGLLSSIDAALAAGGGVSLELGEVTFIDSSGLRVITSAFRQARDGHQSFAVASTSDAVRRVFEVTGVNVLLDQ